MPEPRRLVSPRDGGFFAEIGNQFRLSWRLMSDRRVNPLFKLLPIASILYFISPLDFGIPLLDDAVVIWLGNTLFVELCPPEVVEEHRAAIAQIKKADKSDQIKIDEGDIIDASYKNK